MLSRSCGLPRRCSRHSAARTFPLATTDPAPSYSYASDNASMQFPPSPSQPGLEDTRRASVARSARYPRVAVLLGVQPHWHLPLLLCRGLSTISAAWWAGQTCISIYNLVYGTTSPQNEDQVRNLDSELVNNRTFRRLAVAQICLSFLWVRRASTRFFVLPLKGPSRAIHPTARSPIFVHYS